MGHPAEQTLLAYLDRELPVDERSTVREHLQTCASCAGRLDGLSAAAGELADALAFLDVPAPVLSAAEIQERLLTRALGDLDTPAPAASADELERRSDIMPLRRRVSRRPLLAAALIVIFVAGASAAIPGSPVRAWLERTVQLFQGTPSDAQRTDATMLVDSAGRSHPSAISVQPRDGFVRIMITAPEPATVIRVRLLDRGPASVWSVEGRYRTAPGEIEVLDAGPGEVVVLLPRSVASAHVELDGRLVATKEGPDLRLLIPAADSSEAEVSFQAGR